MRSSSWQLIIGFLGIVALAVVGIVTKQTIERSSFRLAVSVRG